MDETYVLSFSNCSPAEANRCAEELRNVLLDASDEIIVQRQRESAATQDLGGTLVLILGAPAIVALATALGNWLQLRNKVSLTIETADKKLIASNLTSKDASRLAELLLTQQNESH